MVTFKDFLGLDEDKNVSPIGKIKSTEERVLDDYYIF